MKVLLVLIFVLPAFVCEAKAQLCGQYTTTLRIKDSGGKSIENAVVTLSPIKKNETKGKKFVRDKSDSSTFTITFDEGHLIYEKYKLIISAAGFETLEKEIGFPHCERQKFDIQLNVRTISRANKSRFCATITDEQGAVIPNASVEGKSNKGEKFKTTTDSNGKFEVEIFDGLYKILIKADSFKKTVLKNQLLPTEPGRCIQVELKSSVPPHQIK